MTAELTTVAERSGFKTTGRTDEVEALCAAYAARWPEAVRSFQYGRSAEGRPLRALIVSRSGKLDPQALRSAGIPLLMVQAGIHPGESDGKDAGFIALRELLVSTTGTALLQKIAILFVPAFNTDGHERVGRWNRPNQRGPEEMGWRATAQNLNLNRDYMKAQASEMQAMLRLLNEYDPLVCADLHVTDGADFEPDVSLQVEPVNQGDTQLRPHGVQLRDELIDKLAAQGSLPLAFYPDLATTDDPTSGFVLTVYSPRFSTGYFPQRNRFTVLVETHSWKDYATRVRVTRNTIVGLAELMAEHGRRWLEGAQGADIRSAELGGSQIVLDHASGWREPSHVSGSTQVAETKARTIDFRGYAYTRTPSPISGDLVTIYDPKTPQIWRVPFRDTVEPSVTVNAPVGGYIVPAGYADLIGPKLGLHGIHHQRIARALSSTDVEAFRISEVSFSPAPFEGCTRASISGAWRNEQRSVAAGSLYVPISQPHARVLLALLEPQGPDSLLAWGFFNACFEHKEHVEPYVAEQIAREMLAADPALHTEFQRQLEADSQFAANPAARLEFFLRRHASWDDHFNLYPILRTAGLAADLLVP